MILKKAHRLRMGFFAFKVIGGWGVTEQEMHLSPLPAIIRTIFPRFNLINMAMPPICLATNII
jgi:hypothetical protein